MDEGLPPTFNRLSFIDQSMLRSATLVTSLSAIAREDTQAHPKRYPLYAIYLGLSLLPLPGSHVVPSIVLTAWIYNSQSPWAVWAKGRMVADFNPAAMVENNKGFIVENQCVHAKHGARLRILPLTGHASKMVLKDAATTTGHFIKFMRA